MRTRRPTPATVPIPVERIADVAAQVHARHEATPFAQLPPRRRIIDAGDFPAYKAAGWSLVEMPVLGRLYGGSEVRYSLPGGVTDDDATMCWHDHRVLVDPPTPTPTNQAAPSAEVTQPMQTEEE